MPIQLGKETFCTQNREETFKNTFEPCFKDNNFSFEIYMEPKDIIRRFDTLGSYVVPKEMRDQRG